MTDKPKHGGTRKGAGRPPTERDDKAVKMDRTLADMAFVVARSRKVTVAEYLSTAVKVTIEADYSKVFQDFEKRRSK